jgi:hypothetical protein
VGTREIARVALQVRPWQAKRPSASQTGRAIALLRKATSHKKQTAEHYPFNFVIEMAS